MTLTSVIGGYTVLSVLGRICLRGEGRGGGGNYKHEKKGTGLSTRTAEVRQQTAASLSCSLFQKLFFVSCKPEVLACCKQPHFRRTDGWHLACIGVAVISRYQTPREIPMLLPYPCLQVANMECFLKHGTFLL